MPTLRLIHPSRPTLCVALTLTLLACAGARAQENIGTVRQPLVGGGIVRADNQEEFGLLSLSTAVGSCSASLLRNEWIVTAAHCLELKDANGRTMPDPARPGQFVIGAPATLTLNAAWKTPQMRTAVFAETFRPYDVALIKVGKPFTVGNSDREYSRMVFQDGQFPYFGTRVPVPLMVFGAGINQFAQGGAAPTQSQNDGQFRVGFATTRREDDSRYWYPSQGGQMIAGGDSGGPSFAWVLGGYALVGVHSLATTQCVAGQTCGAWPGPGPAPAGYSNWGWVTATPEAADAPVQPVLARIQQIMGPRPVDAEPTGNVGTFAPPGPGVTTSFIYGINSAGQLRWYRHDGARLGTGLDTAGAWKGPVTAGTRWRGYQQVFPGGGNTLYAITLDGQLVWGRHDSFNTGSGTPVEAGMKVVGWGWQNFKAVFSGGNGVIYAIQPDGTLLWYRHTGNGTGAVTWQGPKTVGSGWAGFKQVLSAGDGYLYAVGLDGSLRWYRHTAFATGGGFLAASAPRGPSATTIDQAASVIQVAGVEQVGRVSAVTTGIAVTAGASSRAATTVNAASATQALSAAGTWEGPKVVGSGWQGFRTLFSSGFDTAAGNTQDGVVIYGVAADGKLLWYKHRGYRDGSFSWLGARTVGVGWNGFSSLFALIPNDPDPVR